jgi:hypothetical protein
MKLSREEMIDELVNNDIEFICRQIFRDDYELLDAILRGEGFKQYNNLTDDEIITEYIDRFEKD